MEKQRKRKGGKRPRKRPRDKKIHFLHPTKHILNCPLGTFVPLTKANPHVVTAKFVIGTGSPERVGGLKKRETGELVGVSEKVRNLALLSLSLSCYRKKVSQRNKVPEERKRRAYKRQIQTRKERK